MRINKRRARGGERKEGRERERMSGGRGGHACIYMEFIYHKELGGYGVCCGGDTT